QAPLVDLLCVRGPPPRSTLLPYTTLFRSCDARPHVLVAMLSRAHVLPFTRERDGALEVSFLAPDEGGRVVAYLDRLCRLVRRLRSEEHTSELQSRENLVCRLLLETKKATI